MDNQKIELLAEYERLAAIAKASFAKLEEVTELFILKFEAYEKARLVYEDLANKAFIAAGGTDLAAEQQAVQAAERAYADYQATIAPKDEAQSARDAARKDYDLAAIKATAAFRATGCQ